jgi:molybdate transport system permease protein
MPLAVYQTLESGDLEGAVVLSLIMLVVSVTILATLRDRWLTAP